MAEASALDELLFGFSSNKGTMPQVNPPEAEKVLETQTAPEVAGNPEPELEVLTPPAPTEKPQEVKDAEAKTKVRRTAKVVQEELDAALARIAELEACSGGARNTGYEAELEKQVSDLKDKLDAAKVSLEAAESRAKVAGQEAQGVAELCDALAALGFEATLRRIG